MIMSYLNKHFPFYDEYLRNKKLRKNPAIQKQSKKVLKDLKPLVAGARINHKKPRALRIVRSSINREYPQDISSYFGIRPQIHTEVRRYRHKACERNSKQNQQSELRDKTS